ncbi:MAG: LysM peptidoglycan-binding domain-containing protein [Chloroflexota bacterium]
MSRIHWIVLFAAFCLLMSFQVSAADTPTPTPAVETTTYVVQTGDTLGLIASRNHTTIGALMRLNNLANPELVVIGQTLLIPSATTTAVPSLAATDIPALSSEGTAEATAAFELTAEAQSVTSMFDYGIEAFFDNQNANSVTQQIAALAMHWTKVRISWREYELMRGSIDYPRLDTIVDALEASKLNILLTVTDAPDWARSSQVENGPPDDFADYAAFVSALATHYAGRVRAYEIWNEPNLRREWNSTAHPISAQSYADLLRGAYTAIKAADPAATVVSAGLAPTGFNDGINAIDDRMFLAALYPLGLADISDAVGAHPFGFGNPPDSICCDAPEGVLTHYGHPSFYFLDTLNDYHKIMQDSGDFNTQIWVTEFGWGTSEDTDIPPSNSRFVSYNSLQKQAQYTARAFELGESSGFVGVMIAYNLNSCVAQPDNAEACYYSVISSSGQPRPVYNALSLAFATATNP